MLDGARVEERIHQAEAVVLAFECGLRAGLEGFEHRLEAQHVLAQARAGGAGPLGGVAALHVALHLGAQAQLEAAPGELLEIPRQLRGDQWAAREGDGHVGAQHDVPGVLGRHDQRQVGVVAGLRRRYAVEPQLLGLSGGGRDAGDVGGRLAVAGVLVRVGPQDHRLYSKSHGSVPRRKGG